jgi:hypothetical protein
MSGPTAHYPNKIPQITAFEKCRNPLSRVKTTWSVGELKRPSTKETERSAVQAQLGTEAADATVQDRAPPYTPPYAPPLG